MLGGVITTGGGFSVLSDVPSWQSAYTSAYFSTVATPPVAGYHTQGRGYPDVSLAGAAYEVYIGGMWHSTYGTSASTPVFAGMTIFCNINVLFVHITIYDCNSYLVFYSQHTYSCGIDRNNFTLVV